VARPKKRLHLLPLPWLRLLSQHLHLHLWRLTLLLRLLMLPHLLLLTLLLPLLPSNWIQSKKSHLRVVFFRLCTATQGCFCVCAGMSETGRAQPS